MMAIVPNCVLVSPNMGKQSRLLAVILLIVIGSIYIIAQHPPRLGLDLRGGAQLTLQALPNPKQGIDKITPKILEAAKFVVEKRINGLGVAEASVQEAGESQLLVQLPGVNDPAEAERVLGKTAQLEFRTQKPDSGDIRILENKVAAFEPSGLTGSYLKDAVPRPTNQNQTSWEVGITFDDKGGDMFAKITGELGGTGRSLGIFLDDELISYPSVGPEFQGKGITGGQAVITGNFSLESANEFALQLRAGALPVPVKIVENRTVGATLGADSVQSSIYAGVAGLFLVLVFMVWYYRLPGVVADIALIVYSIITFAAFSILGVTMTLPGIAGFILSIGFAVDANILIFERTREELNAGKTLYKAVEAGFYRAWSSILDSNVTHLIACGALFWLGSGLVKGFAVTLGVGVLTSMFTAITCSRALLLTLISNPDLKRPEYYGVKSIGKAGSQSSDRSTDKPTEATL